MLRSPKERNPVLPHDQLRTRLKLESLEDRLTPSWTSVPPSTIALPSSFVTVTRNSNGDASGSATIATTEVDWYRFTATAGTYTFRASTPSSSVDTVIGIYNASGQRVAYNDDISWFNRDSARSVTLSAGTYYLGITNYIGTGGGSYSWLIDGPTSTVPPSPPPPPPPSPPPPPPPPPTGGGFSITLQLSGLTASQQAIFQQAANRWAQVITGDLPNATYNGTTVDDVLIAASSRTIDGPGGILGQAGPDQFRSGSQLPYHGVMQFDSADLAQLEAAGQLDEVALHEMGHILGIGTVWSRLGLLAGAGTSNPRFTGANAVAAYNAIFGTSATGVPVENSGGAGTRDSHWRESVFGNELMTGYLNSGANPLSRITIASLADIGYQVNLNAADNYTPPGGGSLIGGGGSAGGGGGGNLRQALPPQPCAAPTTPDTETNVDAPIAPPAPTGHWNDRLEQLGARTEGVWVGPERPSTPGEVTAPAETAVDPFHDWLFGLD